MTNPIHDFIRHLLDQLELFSEETRKWSAHTEQLHEENLALKDRVRELEQKRDPNYVRADIHEELVRLAQRVVKAGSVIPLPKDKVQRQTLEELALEIRGLASWLGMDGQELVFRDS